MTAILTSILGSDLISASYPTINTNFNALNVEASTLGTRVAASIAGLNASMLSQITISSVAGASLNVVTGPADRVIAWCKGTVTGSATAGSVALLYDGVIKDSMEVKQAAAADQTGFALMYAESPGAGTRTIAASVVANGSLIINNPRIIAQVIQ